MTWIFKNLPIQIGDVKKTHSNNNSLMKYSSYEPKTNLDKGIKIFIDWYKSYNSK